MLDVDSVVDYLIAAGRLKADDVVHGHVLVEAAPHRNRNLRVDTSARSGYLIKLSENCEADNHDTLRLEAEFYKFWQGESPSNPLHAFIPKLTVFDSTRFVLILDLLPDACTLWEYYSSFTPPAFPLHAARQLGEALATIHDSIGAQQFVSSNVGQKLVQRPPWVLKMHQRCLGEIDQHAPRIELRDL